MAHVKLHALQAQTVQPCPQQRRGLHVGGKDTSRRADKGGNAQAQSPRPQRVGIKVVQPILDGGTARPVAAGKRLGLFGMGQIQATFTRQQEFAPDRGHGIVEMHRHARIAQHLGRHESSRAATDDGHGQKRGGRRGSHSRWK